jgi:hypothetical protein
MRDHSPGSGKVVDLSEGFSHLGAMLNWVGPQYDSIRRGSADTRGSKKQGRHVLQYIQTGRAVAKRKIPEAAVQSVTASYLHARQLGEDPDHRSQPAEERRRNGLLPRCDGQHVRELRGAGQALEVPNRGLSQTQRPRAHLLRYGTRRNGG